MVRAVLSAIAGYVGIGILVVFTDQLFNLLINGFNAKATPPLYYFVISLCTDSFYSFLGGYLCASIAKQTAPLATRILLIGGEVVGAIWEGGETRFGRTLWQSVDASAASGIVALAMKYAFSRVRPIDSNNDPNLWFKAHGNQSFPSGEVTAVSSIITPLVLEYGPEHPLTYALEVLPVYDGIARMKVQAHWQSDVLAGFALGTGTGWLIHRNPNSPFILRVMPHEIYVGIGTRF